MAQPQNAQYVNVSVNGNQAQPLAVAQAVTVATHVGPQRSPHTGIQIQQPTQQTNQRAFSPKAQQYAVSGMWYRGGG